MIGKTLAHYEILELLGKGGMGEVYRAHDTQLDRDIALKLLPEDLARESERRMRFQREAKAIAALSHPNIVTVHSVERFEGLHFLTMELVEGQTLDQVIPSRGLRLDRFFALGIGLADALRTAHQAGITHRDLKPTNIMVDRQGRPKILDFGLAKLLKVEAPDDGITMSMKGSSTREGRVLGTAAYMSPEQAEGTHVDHRSDIFSLGVVLYEMATGQRPFHGDTQMSTLSAILREEPTSVTEIRRQLPRHLGRIIRRCLQKDVERRYQSAADLRNDLQELSDEVSSGQLGASGREAGRTTGKRRWVTVAVGATAAVLVGIGLARQLTVRGVRQSASPTSTPTAVPATSSGAVESGSVSPDGSYVVFVLDERGRKSLRVKQLAGGSEVEIVPPAEWTIWEPRVSADGQDVFYLRRPESEEAGSPLDLYRVPLLGGTPRRVIGSLDAEFALSHDGVWIAFLRTDGSEQNLLIAARDGSRERAVCRIDPKVSWPALAWSPSGESLLCALQVTDPFGFVLAEIDAGTGAVRQRGSHRWTFLSGLHWCDDGRIFLAGSRGGQRFQDTGQIWIQDTFDAAPRALTSGLSEYTGVSLDRSGRILATTASTQDQATWVLPASRPDLLRRIDYVSSVGQWFKNVAWTRDSRILQEYREGEVLHIRALSTDGSRSSLLTTEGPFNMGPAVSPDGATLAFFSNRDGGMHVYMADVDGGGDVRRATQDEEEELFPEFGARGEWLYYHAYDAEAGEFRVRRVRVDGGSSEYLTDGPAGFPRPSPDGERLLVSAQDPDAGHWTLATLPCEGGEPELLGLPDVSAASSRWLRDGTALITPRWHDSVASVWVVPLDGSEPRELATIPHGEVWGLGWNAAGDSLAIVSSRRDGDIVLLRGL